MSDARIPTLTSQRGESSDPPVWRRRALIACMFLITSALGFLQPFVPIYLEAAALSRAEIGMISGLGTGAALLIQPVLGRLSDRRDARRSLMVACALTASFAFTCYRFANGLWAFVALSAIGINGTMYLNAATGVMIARISPRGAGGRTYASYRVWGSVGYIVVALAAGWLLHLFRTDTSRSMDRSMLAPVFAYGPIIFVLVAVSALFTPDRRATVDDTPVLGPERGHPTRPDRERAMRRFLTAFFLYQFSLYGASAYLSLYMQELGAGPLWVTGMFAGGVVCEVLVMTRIGGVSDRLGRRPVLAVAFVALPIRLLCYMPATGPVWVMVVQLLHGLNFGIMGAIAVVYINDLASDSERGRAQARLAAAGGLASAAGPLLCGLIAQAYGLVAMFGVMAVIGAIGAVYFLSRVPESHPIRTMESKIEAR